MKNGFGDELVVKEKYLKKLGKIRNGKFVKVGSFSKHYNAILMKALPTS